MSTWIKTEAVSDYLKQHKSRAKRLSRGFVVEATHVENVTVNTFRYK